MNSFSNLTMTGNIITNSSSIDLGGNFLINISNNFILSSIIRSCMNNSKL